MYSLIVPIYNNLESLPDLLKIITKLHQDLNNQLEAIFVVDGSPDNSYHFLHNNLPQCVFPAKTLLLARNFGSFAAIRAGLKAASGQYFAVMAADLQEPPHLILDFFQSLKNDEADITLGIRTQRDDPLLSRLTAEMYWYLYRLFVQKDMPRGGVDVFACNKTVRDWLLNLEESNSSLVGLLFWLGFRRKLVPYHRLKRIHGKSAWSFRKKLRYLNDSVFSFTDLPIRLLINIGVIGMILSIIYALFLLTARVFHLIQLPGYTTTLLVILFFTALNTLSLGIIGSYVWRAFENSKRRPQVIVMATDTFENES